MKRQVSLEDISDGRLYSRHDLVKVGCGGCRGCSACCHGMGNSAILDPLDVHRLVQGTKLSVEVLMAEKLELHVVDGIILPNLRMSGADEACGFLDAEGRCSIHPYRPGVCRLFPLGRYYEKKNASDNAPESGDSGEKNAGPGFPEQKNAVQTSFRYFVQAGECPAPNKTKVRVEKWLEQPDIAQYEVYVLDWHCFLEKAEARVAAETDEDTIKNIELYILKLFYMKPYDPQDDFYAQFEARLMAARDVLDLDLAER